jgi:hypothetical protein
MRLAPAVAPGLVESVPAPGMSVGSPSASLPAASEGSSVLFIQQAAMAEVKPDPLDASKGTLTLTGVPPYLTWFTDRPQREAGMLETRLFSGKDFMDANGTWLSRPNAALYGATLGLSSTNDTVLILTLGAPHYNSLLATTTYQVGLPSTAAF